ncbi:MAG TPA: hypothetical protein VGE02_11385 [Gemmatimonadales bacterium]
MLTLIAVAVIAFLLGVSVGRGSAASTTRTVEFREMPKFDELPAEIRAAIAGGRRVEAIRLVRKHTGVDLRAAKLAVDGYAQSLPPVAG